MEHRYKAAIIGLFVLMVAWSCAKQSSAGPGGGPKDEDPPVVVKSEPEQGSRNFTGSSFQVTFDEYFTLDNVVQKLLVSPPLETPPTVKTKGKTLVVSFDEELKENVTYTFYFQDALKDLNEGNVYENFQYYFSTGPTIDSLSVTGEILDSYSLEPGEDMYVLLYSEHEDSIPQTMIPRYLTRAGRDGKFRIDHLAAGSYSIYGLKDNNNNKRYDLDDETFAFIDSTITVSPSGNYIPSMPDTLRSAADSASFLRIPGSEYKLYYFTAERKKQYLTSSQRNEASLLKVTLAMPSDTGQFSIRFPGYDNARFLTQPTVSRDTFRIWILDSLLYGIDRIPAVIRFPETDSTGAISISTDTIDFRYIAPRAVRGQAAETKKAISYRSNLNPRNGLKPEQMINYRFDTPVEKVDTSRISLFMTVDTILVPSPYSISEDTLTNNSFVLSAGFIQDSTYLLRTDRGAFTDVYGLTNDSTGVRFRIRPAELFGTLTLNITGFNGRLILQLLRPDEKLVETRRINLPEDSRVVFKYLDKGLYRLKLIFDLDGNGKWTTGDYSIKRQPEPVTYFPRDVDIKVSWELEEDWTITGLRQKNRETRKQ